MLKTKLYIPTDPNATHAAGMRIRSLPLKLTAEQADHELRVGAIAPYEPPVDAKSEGRKRG